MQHSCGADPDEQGGTFESAWAQVVRAKLRGYAVAEGTFDTEVVGMAAPLFAASGTPCGAVAVATPATRFDAATQDRNAAFLIPAAEKISRIYGAHAPLYQSAAE